MFVTIYTFTHGYLENQIQGLSRTCIHRCKDHVHFQGLSKTCIHRFKNHVHFQGLSKTCIHRFKDHVHFQGLSKTCIHRFKDHVHFQGLSTTCIHRFKDFQGPCPFTRTFKDIQGPARALTLNYYDNYLLSAKWFSRLYVCVYVIVLHALSVWRMKVFITTFGVAWFVTASLTKACQLALVLLTPFHCLAHRQVVLPNRHTWINK